MSGCDEFENGFIHDDQLDPDLFFRTTFDDFLEFDEGEDENWWIIKNMNSSNELY